MKVLLFGATGTAAPPSCRHVWTPHVWTKFAPFVRRPLGRTDSKLREIVRSDYLDFAGSSDAFRSVDACLFCLGTSVTQVSKHDFLKISHDFPIAAAHMLKKESPAAAFHYISGAGTRADSKTFWSQVKGKTENELMDLVGAVCWRPGFIDAPASPSIPRFFAAMQPVFRLLKPFRSLYVLGEDIGKAMLQATKQNFRRRIIENPEIRTLAKQFGS